MMKVRCAAPIWRKQHSQGAPLATIEEALVPLYMYHRYQVEAAARRSEVRTIRSV